MNTSSRIAISWHNLPMYAARSICAGIQNLSEPVEIIASKPPTLVAQVENTLSQSVHWIDANKACSWSDLGLNPPEIFFQSGWLSKAFRNLGEEVRRNGGRVVCLSDNSWKNNPKQWLGAIIFRIHHRLKFHAIWVPGNSGFKLCRFFGMPANRIYQGMYGADAEVFIPGSPLAEREKKFIFVGQLIERKGIDILARAFSEFYKSHPDWSLHVIGSGPLTHLLHTPGIKVEEFKPPNYIASMMRQSRFLILPSRDEHWGLVVHEAVLSRCGVIASKSVGASLDLISEKNGLIVDSGCTKSLHQALEKAASLKPFELEQIFLESQTVASKFGPHQWAETFERIITDSLS